MYCRQLQRLCSCLGTHRYVCMHVRMYMNYFFCFFLKYNVSMLCIYVYMYLLRIYVYIHVCMYVYIHVCMYIYMYVCMHDTYKHICLHSGAVAASMLGFILPALLYFATNWTNLHDTYNAALFLHSIHHEGRPTSIHGCLSHTYQIASMFSSYYLPVLMVIFGLMALLIGVSTILVEYNR